MGESLADPNCTTYWRTYYVSRSHTTISNKTELPRWKISIHADLRLLSIGAGIDFAVSRAQSINSSASGLSVRSLTVMMPTANRIAGRLIDKIFSPRLPALGFVPAGLEQMFIEASSDGDRKSQPSVPAGSNREQFRTIVVGPPLGEWLRRGI